jgi:uncharacterized membrane protein YeaQ/YmgE (transglycosylase-associated protein family)
MDLLFAILIWMLFGLLCGAIARLLIPGKQPIGVAMTMVLGIVGSFVGGFLAYLFFGGEPLQASGVLLSIVGATIVLAIYVYSVRSKATRGA